VHVWSQDGDGAAAAARLVTKSIVQKASQKKKMRDDVGKFLCCKCFKRPA
jgi:hypothetical protein